ncbi:MAG: TRAP transporter small permease subunit [Rhodobacteraceae bacterium]|nr:TRAP transporter small permease subunit [Paracoccaceae bacterium]MCB2139939.1 TRAP transporter small permease subunit [Paracoccaceae bacterium]MCB2143696.1 TRAP transporter small permease subunit [Paracoccaceae bacterium]MCB2150014.1 TRAP transporter small permease subunit [Paracoccaceae bacterium]
MADRGQRTLAALDTLGAFNRGIGAAGVFAASALIALMTVFVILGVFFRYVLNDSLTWVEDVALILMVTTAFIVAPHAFRSGANVAIELFTTPLPATAVRVLRLVINMLILWIVYRYFFESLALVNRGWGIRVNTVPIAWAWPYMIVPVAFAAMALVAVELIGRDIWALLMRSKAADLPHDMPQEPE